MRGSVYHRGGPIAPQRMHMSGFCIAEIQLREGCGDLIEKQVTEVQKPVAFNPFHE